MEIPEIYKKNLYRMGLVFAVILSLYFVVKFLNEFQSLDSSVNKVENTISFSGHGEVSAVPDIANVDFSIQKDASTVKEAQDGVAQIEKKSLDFLRANSIADKDIKTTNSSFYPKYEYRYQKQMPCTQSNCPPPIGNSVIVGYTASENITVKIRNTDDAGKIIQGLGTLGVSNLNGPNFAIDNEDSLKIQARKLAIDDAKAKAKSLAQDLGVSLGKITSFNESGNNPAPMMYAKAMMADGGSASSAPAEIPKGENKISSDVTITYQIR